jgi:hypothetical protein
MCDTQNWLSTSNQISLYTWAKNWTSGHMFNGLRILSLESIHYGDEWVKRRKRMTIIFFSLQWNRGSTQDLMRTTQYQLCIPQNCKLMHTFINYIIIHFFLFLLNVNIKGFLYNSLVLLTLTKVSLCSSFVLCIFFHDSCSGFSILLNYIVLD